MPNVNIALDLFGIVVLVIILFSCLEERIKKESTSNSFIFIILSVLLALTADIVSWIGEGNPCLATMTTVGNTIASCVGYVTTLFFMLYMRKNLFSRSRVATVVTYAVCVAGIFSVIVISINSYNGIFFGINTSGHYVHNGGTIAMLCYLQFPVFALLTTALMVISAQGISARTRISYMLYILFPTVGTILDYLFHGLSLAYIGMVTSIMIIYTNIYLQKRKLISKQRTALMISQINPHFMYNTLSAIAALCEIDPKEAKSLTVEFSSFLRQNLETLSTNKLIPIEQELKHVGCYLKIEKARFKDKINVDYSIQSSGFFLPALTIQPIVENAIKHGITKKSGGGTVKISTYRSDKFFIIEIKDDGIGFEENAILNTSSNHVGIENVRNRLKDMCDGKLDVKSMVGIGTRVTISIPVKKAMKE